MVYYSEKYFWERDPWNVDYTLHCFQNKSIFIRGPKPPKQNACMSWKPNSRYLHSSSHTWYFFWMVFSGYMLKNWVKYHDIYRFLKSSLFFIFHNIQSGKFKILFIHSFEVSYCSVFFCLQDKIAQDLINYFCHSVPCFLYTLDFFNGAKLCFIDLH